MDTATTNGRFSVAGKVVKLEGRLPPTKTHKNRRSYSVTAPAVDAKSGLRWMARVEITQSGKLEVYLFDEIPAEHAPIGFRRFIFSNQTSTPTKDRPGLYAVTVDPDGHPTRCDCTGAVTGLQQERPEFERTEYEKAEDGTPVAQTCKHKDVTLAMFLAGFFTSPDLD